MSELFDENLFKALGDKAAAAPTPAPFVPAGLAGDDVLAASSALKPLTPVIVPGMARPFQSHQAAAFNYVLGSIERWNGSLLGHDMGLGKTQVLLATVAHFIARKPGYSIMIAPPVAVAGYRDDLAAAFPHLRMVHLKGRRPERDANGAIVLPAEADIYFMSDDPLTLKAWLTDGNDPRGRSIPSSFATGAVVLTRDEIHRDKGNMGKPTTRSKVMLAVAKALRERGVPVIGATGTILTNRPVEAYLPLQIVGGPELVKTVTPGASSTHSFMFRYCAPVNNGFGYNYNGCDLDRMSELHEYLRRTVYTRVEKRDLGDDLPHSGWIVKPIALGRAILRRYADIEEKFLQLVLDEEGPESMWRKARAEAICRMQAMWEEAGNAKVGATVEYVAELVEQGRQVVLFYYHQDSHKALLKALESEKITVTTINGSVTGEARVNAVHEFQNGDAQVMLAQIRAAGMAVTLTAAADAVFHQVPWSAGDLKQAADRILRSDDLSRQRAARGEKVTWHVIQAAYDNGDPTFDMAMWGILERKALVCDAVNAGRQITMPDESIMRQALEAWFPNARRGGKPRS
jgi:Helicase conserved C-terminal domain